MSASEENGGARKSASNTSDPFLEEQTVLILVGLIASGKSTFAEALERHFPRFRRCNQDELGNRQRVEELAYYTLSEGRSPCIDRTNFNATQRSYWSAIARASPKTSISIIVFDTPYHNRQLTVGIIPPIAGTSHPTIKNAQEGMAILQRFASDFQLPSPDEGYDHLIYLRPTDRSGPEYTRDDILSILERLKASTWEMGTAVTTRRSVESYFGRYSRTSRGRGYRGDGYQGSSHTRGTLYGSSRFASRVGSSNWRRLSPGAVADRETSDHPRSATLAVVPAMEGSKSRDSAVERHNST